MEQWKGQAVHDTIGMILLVGGDLHPHREAVQTQVKVRTDCALDAHHTSDILLTVVAVKQAPALGILVITKLLIMIAICQALRTYVSCF